MPFCPNLIGDPTTNARVERIKVREDNTRLIWVSGTSADEVNEMANRVCVESDAEYINGDWSDELGEFRFYGVYVTHGVCYYGGGNRVNYARAL